MTRNRVSKSCLMADMISRSHSMQIRHLSLEVRGIFLAFKRGISKAFDKVWYYGLLFKLKRLGLYGKYCGQ